jgi:F-type H+-transporting ATPase subunit a
VTSELVAPGGVAEEPGTAPTPRGRGVSSRWFTLIGVVILLDIAAIIFAPPFPKGGAPGDACAFPVCYIQGTLEFPAPHVVLSLTSAPPPSASQLIVFYPSISSTILTQWIVIVLILVVSILMVGRKMLPGAAQNAYETLYESLSDFGIGLAGESGRPYVPIFVAFFLLILFSNWIGLVPPVGRLEELRAPSSDLNITLGLALVSFVIFEFEGFHRLGVGGYLGKFFPFYEFRNGIGAGLLALFVGLLELMLEFVKLVTLSVRLFGNIYAGEVALGVVTALTLAIVPVALLGLDFLLNAIQALIFSVLTLVFITLAIESHDHEEGHVAEEAMATIHAAESQGLQPAH